MVYVRSATFIHYVSLSIMCFFFHMVKRAGIWTSPYNNAMGMHIAQKKLHSCFDILLLHIYPSEVEPPNPFKGGRLFQQFTYDGWASIEQYNLTWAANNQTKFRADLYQGLQDCMHWDGGEGQNLGQVGHVILPSTHKGGPCYMQQLL